MAWCLENVSAREYQLWRIYFRLELEEPDRQNWYQMQTSMEIVAFRKALAGDSSETDLNQFVIPFLSAKEKAEQAALRKKQDEEEFLAKAKIKAERRARSLGWRPKQ